ncbi:hypothetical protein ZWY2020_011928 [Hordeum vulgare]|nr:hypothetical protein ZWY2020_011928 [Hordeum vulgare]
MEFSMVDHPPCARFSGDDVAIVEAGQGMTVMFVPKPDTAPRVYTVWRNNGGSSVQWQMDNEPFSLDSGSLLQGAVGTRHADVLGTGDAVLVAEPREAGPGGVKAGTPHADVIQGVGRDDVGVPGGHAMLTSREQGSLKYEGLQGPVVAAAARAPNPLFVIEGTPHADVAQRAGVNLLVSELREADPEGVQGHVVAAAAHAPDPLLVLCGRFEEDAQGTDNQEEKRRSNEHKVHEEQSDGKKLNDQTEAPTIFLSNYETL